jgi:ribosomal protein S18 acetylase RimI-like enzyme
VVLAEDWFRSRDAHFTFWLRVPDDGSVVAHAVTRGYSELASQPAMLLAPIPQTRPSSALTVMLVADEDGAQAYASAELEEADRYGRHHEPDLSLARAMLANEQVRLFVGFVAGRAVARSMVVLHGRMAGLSNIYVAPSVRGRGLGDAITRTAISAGEEMGAAAACLEASAMGEGLYRKMGFRQLYRYVRLGFHPVGSPSGAANEDRVTPPSPVRRANSRRPSG